MEQRWLDLWTPVIQRFDPFSQPGREGVPARFYVPRPDSPLGRLEFQLRLNLAKPRAILLTGHRGSGKSSELARLADQIADAMTVVWLDVSKRLDMHNFSQTDLLIAMAATINQYIPVPRAFDVFKEQLMTVIEERLDSRSASFVVKALQAVGVEGKISLFDREQRQRIELPPVIGGVYDGLNTVIAAARSQTRQRPLLLVVDQTQNLDLETARPILVNNPLLASLDCHLVLAIPFALFASTAREELQQQGFMPFMLPNVKLHGRYRAELDPAGVALMEEIVRCRLADFGPLIDPGALRRFIEMSGGVIRELILFMNHACAEAAIAGSDHITPPIAEKVIQTVRFDKALGIPYSFYREEMAKVHLSGELTETVAKDEQGREFIVCAQLLHTLYLLAYGDGDPWYDVHPLMLSVIQEHLKRANNESAS